ncbi:MAG: recombination mediator RecR [Patescibacteria group bacterium]|jgi:recombination protein RecR
MKNLLPKSIDELVDQLSRLPGIGPKSASRLAFALMQRSNESVEHLAQAILMIKKDLRYCSKCYLITDKPDLCVVCQNDNRDQSIICVVEESLDVVAIESSHGFNGTYHVLGGVISPIDGVGPEQLTIAALAARIGSSPQVKEIIIATNPTLEGEATSMYLCEQLKPFKIKISRIARGLPSGGDLEYADEVTLLRALEGRQVV